MSRPRKPVETHLRNGSYRPDRHGERGALVALPSLEPDTIPEAPRPLGPEGKKTWDRIWAAGRGWLSPASDLDLVLILCETVDERIQLRVRVIRQGEWRDRIALRWTDKQILQQLNLLGFSPSSRAALGVAQVTQMSVLDRLLASRHRTHVADVVDVEVLDDDGDDDGAA